MTDPSADLLKVRDVAKLYDVTTQAVYLWIKDRGLPTVRLGGELKTEAHHDDYGIPLGVRWLCRKHHCQWHRRNGPGLNRPSKYRHRPKNVDQQREERITAIVDEAMASLRIQWQREPAEGR